MNWSLLEDTAAASGRERTEYSYFQLFFPYDSIEEYCELTTTAIKNDTSVIPHERTLTLQEFEKYLGLRMLMMYDSNFQVHFLSKYFLRKKEKSRQIGLISEVRKIDIS